MADSISTSESRVVNKRSRLGRHLLQIGLCLLLLYGAAFAGFDYAMHQPPQTFSRVMMHAGPVPFLLFPFESMWKHARQGHLRTGDIAPDFTLPLLGRSGADPSGTLALSSLRGVKLVVLVFGSYT